jgi:hypothetical protein
MKQKKATLPCRFFIIADVGVLANIIYCRRGRLQWLQVMEVKP